MLLQHKEDIGGAKYSLKMTKEHPGENVIRTRSRKQQSLPIQPVHLCNKELYQLGFVKEEVGLLVLVAAAPVTVNPAGGAIELWLG